MFRTGMYFCKHTQGRNIRKHLAFNYITGAQKRFNVSFNDRIKVHTHGQGKGAGARVMCFPET